MRVGLSSPICIIIGGRLNKTVESVNNHTVTNYYDADTTHAGASAIGCFKVYCYKVLHYQSFLYSSYISEIQPFIDLRKEAGLTTSIIAPTWSNFITKSYVGER